MHLISQMYQVIKLLKNNKNGYEYNMFPMSRTVNKKLRQQNDIPRDIGIFQKIKDIELIKKDGNIKFKTKDLIIKEHSCLTSYKGLKELSLYLLNECNSNDKKKHNELEFDYYQYDLTTIINAFDILDVLGYQIIEK